MPPLFTHPPSSLATPPSVFRCLSTVISFGSNIRNIDLSTCTRNLLENICVSFIVAPNRAYSINICNKIYAYNGNNGRINKSDSSFRVLTLRPSFVPSTLLFFSLLPSGKRSSSCFDATDFFSLEYFLAPSPVVTQSGHELHFLTYLYVLGNETMQREIMENGTDLWRIVRYTQEENDVVRIYNDSPPNLRTCLAPRVYLYVVCGNVRTYVGCDDDDDVDHLSILERAIFFFGITILPFAGKGKKKNARAAGRGRGKKCSTRAHDCGITA